MTEQEKKQRLKEQQKRYSLTLRGKYKDYKYHSKQRGIDFNITQEEFQTFWKQDCSYCGDKIETIGLDRINSRLGYTIDNLVPCCTSCNYMKLSDDVDVWFSKMKKIIFNIETKSKINA